MMVMRKKKGVAISRIYKDTFDEQLQDSKSRISWHWSQPNLCHSTP